MVNEDQGTAIGTEDKDSSQALSTDGKEDTWFMSSIIINVILIRPYMIMLCIQYVLGSQIYNYSDELYSLL